MLLEFGEENINYGDVRQLVLFYPETLSVVWECPPSLSAHVPLLRALSPLWSVFVMPTADAGPATQPHPWGASHARAGLVSEEFKSLQASDGRR